MTKIDSRLRQQCSKLCNMVVVGVLSLAPCYSEKIRTAGTSPGVPGDILGSYEELRWMEPHMSSPSPCKRKIIRNEEVLHLFRCYTHTHTSRFDHGPGPIRILYCSAMVCVWLAFRSLNESASALDALTADRQS